MMENIKEVLEKVKEWKEEIIREVKEEIRSEILELHKNNNVGMGTAGNLGGANNEGGLTFSIKKEVVNTVREEDDRSREKNVVIQGYKGNEREERAFVEALIKDKLKLRNIDVMEVLRLGKKTG